MSMQTAYEAPSPPASPEIFARQGYLVLPKLIEPPLVDFLWSYVHTKFATRQMSLGDKLAPNTPSAYADSAFEGLLEYLRPRIAACVGRRLYPTYSHFRLYKHGDGFRRHVDRPAGEFAVSLNIGQAPSDPWPLHIKGKTGRYAALLTPGDALLYRGTERPHWREPYPGVRLAQAFLQYVDADGPYADLKFDGREALMLDKPNKLP
jgi:hypothetical protein